MNAFELFKLLLQLTPALIQAIKCVEVAMPDSPGAHKLAAATAAFSIAATHAGEALVTVQALREPVQALASSIVGIFNTAGVFTKKTPA